MAALSTVVSTSAGEDSTCSAFERWSGVSVGTRSALDVSWLARSVAPVCTVVVLASSASEVVTSVVSP